MPGKPERNSKAMSAADNMKCDICGNNHHPMTECRDASRSLASAPCSSVEFRLLNQTDTIHPDDEFLTDDCQTWARVGDEALKFMIGKPYSATFFQPMRRKVYPTNAKIVHPASENLKTPTPQ
jgi:hypothetical protein